MQVENRQQAGKKRTGISGKWIASVACLLVIAFAGMFINHQQLSAKNSMATEAAEPVEQNETGQVQVAAIQKMARSNDTLATKPSIWPTTGEITSGVGLRNSPWGEGLEFHPGIDIANNMETPIVATADGEVVETGWSDGYGNIVEIDHGNGIVTLYGHNSHITVNVGDSVKKGQVISYMGSTGRSTGPHAHYEIRINGTAVDPTSFLVQY